MNKLQYSSFLILLLAYITFSQISRFNLVSFSFFGNMNVFSLHMVGNAYVIFRQEDAQEFLSFVMEQMHDELLNLEGQFTSVNGSKSSIVSSLEDDEWETVGPKNKSAVTRTQSFVPSELSQIFGGQLRSLVRAKGRK